MKYYVGIDLGGTNIVAGIVDENHEIITKADVKTNLPRDYKAIADDMVKVSFEAVEKAGLTMDQIEWIGVGCPGTVNRDTGIVEYANNLEFYNAPLTEYLENKFNKKVYMDNDANAAGFGEFVAGAAKGTSSAVAITLGTGVGSGIILDGKIYSGSNFAGAEIGHSVLEVDGNLCTCGRRGCFETYSSATALINMTKKAMEASKETAMWEMAEGDINKASGKTAFDGMRAGDKVATEVVNEYIKYLAAGITNVINIFQPDVVCIGGGISKEKETLLAPLREIVSKEVYSRYSKKNTKLVAATLGSEAGVIGAAMLGFAI
ncbi:MAG: hypothetical protein K0R90_496 [Oscillospiraceae bacterium]|jgi:glucokinase|nr:hypothetical protein [Oscillospiraceae bacterium]